MPDVNSILGQTTSKILTWVQNNTLSSANSALTGTTTAEQLEITGSNGLTLSDSSGGISLNGGSITFGTSGGVSLTDGSVVISGSGGVDLSVGTGYIYAGDIDLSTRDGSITFGTNGSISLTDGGVSISGTGSIDLSSGSGYIYAGDIDLSTRDGSITFGTMGGISLTDGTVSISGSGYIDAASSSGTSSFGSGGIDVAGTIVLSNNGSVDLSGGSGTLSMGSGAINLNGGGISDSSQISIGTSGISVSGNSEFQNDLLVTGDLTVSGTTTTVNSTTLETADVIIELAKNADDASNATTDAGIHMTRGSMEDGIFMGWDEGDDAIIFKSHQDGGGVTDVSMATGVADINVKIDANSLLTEGTTQLGKLEDVDAVIAAL